MKDWAKIRSKLVKQKYPSKEELENLKEKYNEISSFIEKEFEVETFFAGSAGRATCRKGDRDIDLFVMFPEDVERNELERKGLEIGEKTFKQFEGEYEVEYAEHPYTKGDIDGFEVEIVPCYDVNPENIKSAVDRSPHHAKWVKNNLPKKQKEDVVLLKHFLYSGELYGSSLKVRGFSGYLCEILIHEYGSLENLVREAKEWGEMEVIDPEDYHEELPGELKKKFSEDSLVVIDPVDLERNVASVLTTENYSKFIYRCWSFVQEPGFNFFERKEVQVDRFTLKKELENRGNFIVIEIGEIDRPDDIVYPQMRKAMKRIRKKLKKHDFTIYDSGFYVGEPIKIFFELNDYLPGIMHQKGPKIFHGTEHLEEFTSKYENVFVESDRLYAKIEREYTNPRQLLKDFLDGEKEELSERGIPADVAEKVEDFRMVAPLDGEDEEWLKFLTEELRIEP